jgi:hypothetical protein
MLLCKAGLELAPTIIAIINAMRAGEKRGKKKQSWYYLWT